MPRKSRWRLPTKTADDSTSHTCHRNACRRARISGHATYATIFWAAKEWLVLSLAAERLDVEKPFAEDLNAGMIGVAVRLTSNVTIGGGARLRFDPQIQE